MIDGTVLITGGDQPLGAAIAERMSEASDDIVLGGADGEQLEEAVAQTNEGSVHSMRTDPRDEYDLERLAETAAKTGDGGIGLVIPAARISHNEPAEPLTDIAYASLDDELRTNLRGVFATIKEVAPHATESTKFLVPVTDTTEISETYAIGESAIKRLVEGVEITTGLSIAAVDVGDSVSNGELDVDRAAGSVVAAATKDTEEYDGRVFQNAD